MPRRVAAVLGCLAVAACAADDGDWVVRPPGGGTGGTGQQIDAAAPVDARDDAFVDDDAGTGLVGQICVVTDLRAPDACPAVTAAAGVLVRVAGDTLGATSDASGGFTLDVTGAQVLLDVGSGSTTLQPAIVPVVPDGNVVHAPIATRAAWTATVAALPATIAPGSGSIAVYTDTAAGVPAAGVIYELPEGALRSPFYDRGDALTWTTGGGGTGPTGTTLIVDLAPGFYTLEANQGARQLSISNVPVYADAVTFVRGRLPP